MDIFILPPLRHRENARAETGYEAQSFQPHKASANDGVGFAYGLVEMLKDVIEGISSSDVDVTRLESQAVLHGADRNAGCGSGGGRLGSHRLLLFVCEMRVEFTSVNIPPQLKE